MKRGEFRHIGGALAKVSGQIKPDTLIARAQLAWPEVVGPQIAAVTKISAEHSGRLTVSCASAVWAQELELSHDDLLKRLKTVLREDEIEGLRITASYR